MWSGRKKRKAIISTSPSSSAALKTPNYFSLLLSRCLLPTIQAFLLSGRPHINQPALLGQAKQTVYC